MAYATLAELRSWLSIDDTWDDLTLGATLLAAESSVDAHCGWRFVATAGTRRFALPEDSYLLALGQSPLATLTGATVAVDLDDDGTCETVLSASEWQGEPFDGLGPSGETGWPYTRLRAVAGRVFPAGQYGRASVQVTGTFGWAAVPENVRQATLVAAAWLWAQKASPSGVQMTEFGPMTIRQMPQAERLLAPYRRGTAIVGIGGML